MPAFFEGFSKDSKESRAVRFKSLGLQSSSVVRRRSARSHRSPDNLVT